VTGVQTCALPILAKFREDLIDNLDTEQGMKMASQPRVAEFI